MLKRFLKRRQPEPKDIQESKLLSFKSNDVAALKLIVAELKGSIISDFNFLKHIRVRAYQIVVAEITGSFIYIKWITSLHIYAPNKSKHNFIFDIFYDRKTFWIFFLTVLALTTSGFIYRKVYKLEIPEDIKNEFLLIATDINERTFTEATLLQESIPFLQKTLKVNKYEFKKYVEEYKKLIRLVTFQIVTFQIAFLIGIIHTFL